VNHTKICIANSTNVLVCLHYKLLALHAISTPSNLIIKNYCLSHVREPVLLKTHIVAFVYYRYAPLCIVRLNWTTATNHYYRFNFIPWSTKRVLPLLRRNTDQVLYGAQHVSRAFKHIRGPHVETPFVKHVALSPHP